MSYRETEHLQMLIANERKDRLALAAPIVANLGHEVIAREIDVKDCEHDRGRRAKSSIDVARPKFAGLTHNQPR